MPEFSEYGYWIMPNGTVIPMMEMQDHGMYLIRNKIAESVDPLDACYEMVNRGWIKISFAPGLTEWSIHFIITPRENPDKIRSELIDISRFYRKFNSIKYDDLTVMTEWGVVKFENIRDSFGIFRLTSEIPVIPKVVPASVSDAIMELEKCCTEILGFLDSCYKNPQWDKMVTNIQLAELNYYYGGLTRQIIQYGSDSILPLLREHVGEISSFEKISTYWNNLNHYLERAYNLNDYVGIKMIDDYFMKSRIEYFFSHETNRDVYHLRKYHIPELKKQLHYI
jgi:hypothetical protein